MRVVYTINKADVFREVGRLTAYAGAKKQGDEGTYERVSTTDSDSDMLEQFWDAACSAATSNLMEFAEMIDKDPGKSADYEVVMDMSSLYDTNLNESIEDGLKNFFINLIVSKWFKMTNPDDEAKYAAEALGYMADVEAKIYHRKRAVRN